MYIIKIKWTQVISQIQLHLGNFLFYFSQQVSTLGYHQEKRFCKEKFLRIDML